MLHKTNLTKATVIMTNNYWNNYLVYTEKQKYTVKNIQKIPLNSAVPASDNILLSINNKCIQQAGDIKLR